MRWSVTSGTPAAGTINLWDDDTGVQLFILDKLHPDRKFDGCMAAILVVGGAAGCVAVEEPGQVHPSLNEVPATPMTRRG
jgi:hypothetical protein